MTAGGSHLQYTLDVLLPTDIGEVGIKLVLLGKEFLAGVDNGGLVLLAAIDEMDDIEQRVHAIDLEVVDDGGLTCVLSWHDESAVFQCPRLDGDGQCAAYGQQASVESQFAYHHVFPQQPLLYLVVGCQDGDGQRQVVAAAFLLDVGRSHVDGDFTDRIFEAAVAQCCPYAIYAFADGRIGQTREMEVDAVHDVYLDGHVDRFESHHGSSLCFYQHKNK